ncbi:MAG: CoA transferase [Acidimicrobiales bacterium]
MLRARIEEFAKLGGLALDESADVAVEGVDPVAATPFRIGEGAATVLALLGQEAAGIGQLRGLPPQAIRVDVRHAAASLHSFLLLQVEGGIAGLFGSRALPFLTRVVECRHGRFIHLHGSFDPPERVLHVLGLGATADAAEVSGALSARDAFEVEDDLAAAGLCGAVCRTPEEWWAHPQGLALAAAPLVEITRIGDADPRPWDEANRPLAGVRVLDLTRVLAGPTVARTLAEHGADVLHISAPHLPTVPLFEIDTGHGKRQASLDLRAQADLATLRGLAATCDVFSDGFQAGSLARRGLGPEELSSLRPGIVYVTENAYGHSGPWHARPGWEQLAQAATGVTCQQSSPVPAIVPAAMNDYTTGYLGALGAMVALRRRAVEGGSWLVGVSLARTAMWFQALGADLDPARAQPLGDLAPLMEARDTGYGHLSFLRPALEMSATPPYFAETVRPLGSDPPVWAA